MVRSCLVGLLCTFPLLAQTKTSAELRQQIETLQAKDAQSPELPGLYLDLGTALKKNDEMPDAEAVLKQALQRTQDAVRKNPADPKNATQLVAVHGAMADLYLRMQRWKDFTAQLEQARTHAQSLTPNLTNQIATLRVSMLAMQGQWVQMRYDEAAEQGTQIAASFAKLHETNPKDNALLLAYAEHLNNTAATYFRMGHTKTSLQLLQQAIALAKSAGADDKALHWQALSTNDMALVLRDSGRTVDAEKTYLAAIELAEQRAQADPKNERKQQTVARMWQNLEIMYAPLMSHATKTRYQEQAATWRTRTAKATIEDQDELATTYSAAGANLIGGANIPLGNVREYYDRMVGLAKKHPHIPAYRVMQVQSSAIVLNQADRAGDMAGALAILEESRTMLVKLVEENSGIPLYRYLTLVYDAELIAADFATGKPAAAKQRYEQGLEAWTALCKQHPKNTYISNMASQVNLINVSHATAKSEHALALSMYQFSLTMQRDNLKRVPDDVYFRLNATKLLEGLAALQQNARDKGGLAKTLTEAIAGWEGLTKDYPDVPDYAFHLATMRVYLAHTLDDQERYADAVTQCAAAAQLMQKWLQNLPERTAFATKLTECCVRAAKSSLNDNQLDKAIDWYTHGIAAGEAARKREAKSLAHLETLAGMYKQRALLHNRMGKTQQYDADWKQADELERESARLETAKP